MPGRSHPNAPDTQAFALPGARLLARIGVGGALMGIANIIPGVSGGTMILATGLYQRFVDSVADVTRLKFRPGPLVFLAVLGLSALLAIFATVTPINWGLRHCQHLMFAAFIGLTLGGVPLIWRDLTPLRPSGVSGAVAGLALMVAVSLWLSKTAFPASFPFLFVGGIVGSAAMVLPGISGSYLLLAMGLYSPITAGIEQFKEALKALDMAAAMPPALEVLLPVGLGVLVGIIGLTNLLKAALHKWRDPTLGALLGLLLGSVFFLYPFREPGHRDPFEAAAPITPGNVALVVLCILVGFIATFALSRIAPDDGHGDGVRE
jgi:putative membrane protein